MFAKKNFSNFDLDDLTLLMMTKKDYLSSQKKFDDYEHYKKFKIEIFITYRLSDNLIFCNYFPNTIDLYGSNTTPPSSFIRYDDNSFFS